MKTLKRKKMVSFLLGMVLLGCTYPVYAEEVVQEHERENVKTYDVIVVGSDPEGVIAAATAAEYGQDVLLIDERAYAGGLYTSGMLTMLDLNYKDSANDSYVNDGAFLELYNEIGIHASFDIEDAKDYFHGLLDETGAESIWEAESILPIVEDNTVQGITYEKEGESYTVHSPIVIDALPDAPVARAAGAKYMLGREDIGSDEYAAATLVFGLEGVDWERVREHLGTDGSIYTGSTENAAWGYANMLDYTPVTDARFQLRSLNLSLQTSGEVIINAFQIFGVDALDEVNQKEAYAMAYKELPHVVEYIRANGVGFENATLGNVADELYLREGVRILGLDTLTAEDAFNNTNFDNRIGYGSYPMDLQSTKRDAGGGTILTGRNLYSLPMGIMIPEGVDGLLVVGRSASYDSIVHSSARTVPVGIAVGEAAGVLATYSNWSSVSPSYIYEREMLVGMVQEMLIKRGVELDLPLPTEHSEHTHWSYPAIQSLRGQALLSKESNYRNEYHESKQATLETINRMVHLIKVNTALPINTIEELDSEMTMTHENTLKVMNLLLGVSYATINEYVEAGMITQKTSDYYSYSEQMLNGHMYLVMNDLVSYLRVTHQMPLPSTEALIHQDLVLGM